MVFVCSFRGCQSTTHLFSFPSDPVMARRWLASLGRAESTKTTSLRVCKKHFSTECFSNYMEFQMGFASYLRLRGEAVPTPADGPPPKLLREASCQTEARQQADAECQTKPSHKTVSVQTGRVGMHSVSAQVNRKPTVRSKAIQAIAPHRSVECDTSSLDPLALVELPVKRDRSEMSDDSSCHSEVTETSSTEDRTVCVTPPQKLRKYTVFEDGLPVTKLHSDTQTDGHTHCDDDERLKCEDSTG